MFVSLITNPFGTCEPVDWEVVNVSVDLNAKCRIVMKARPALGPKGLIEKASVTLVCGMPLFPQVRLLLVILASQRYTQLMIFPRCTSACIALWSQTQFQDVALLHVMSCA